jgi:chromosome partitioning protein
MNRTIITIATMKGGSGKSTLASCLAVHWQLQGHKTVVVDADPQQSIVRLASRERALGGITVVADATDQASHTAQRALNAHSLAIVDTPGFRSDLTVGCLGIADLVLVPVKPSPFDIDRMLDTLNILINGVSGRQPIFRCVLTQTTRDSVIAKHIRAELAEAGFPTLKSELTNRVAYPEAALWGATPSLIEKNGPASRDIVSIAREIEGILRSQKSAAVA